MTTRAQVHVHRDRPRGEVSRRLYGHFSEHLHTVIYGGLWAELLEHRKFEMPGVHGRLEPVAPGWQSIQPAGTLVHRGDSPQAHRFGPDAHHAQLISFSGESPGAWAGLRQGGLALDSGVTYEARVRVQAIGSIERLRLVLEGADGEELDSADLPLPSEAALMNPALPEPLYGGVVEARLRSSGTTPAGSFALLARGGATGGQLLIHAASLLPAGHLDGLHQGAAEALRELPAVCVKYPGGCFADSYDWRLGIGPRDLRHGAADYAWGTWDENDFGTDEFLRWCEMTGTEPYLCVNQGSGGPELAAAWVEYCNGPADSAWGSRRAANGHPEPYGVKLWAVGNEVYGWWERGHLDARAYAERVRRFGTAMRAVDPSILIAAQGDTGPFSRALLPLVADCADWLSVHHYSDGIDPAREPDRYIAAGRDFERVLGSVAEGAGGIRIALDEWGWTNPSEHGQLAVAYSACVLNALTRLAPSVAMAGHCCVINPMAPVTRIGERVTRNGLYDLFGLYNRLHRDTAAEVSGGQAVDATALVAEDGASVLMCNVTGEAVQVEVSGIDAGASHWIIGEAGVRAGRGTSVGLGPYEVAGFAEGSQNTAST